MEGFLSDLERDISEIVEISNPDTKHEYLMSRGFEYDDYNWIYKNHTAQGLPVIISKSEFDRQYLHQLKELVYERFDAAQQAWKHDNHN